MRVIVMVPFAGCHSVLSDILFDILLDTGELISVIVIPEQLFNTYNSPFLLTVKEEGAMT